MKTIKSIPAYHPFESQEEFDYWLGIAADREFEASREATRTGPGGSPGRGFKYVRNADPLKGRVSNEMV